MSEILNFYKFSAVKLIPQTKTGSTPADLSKMKNQPARYEN